MEAPRLKRDMPETDTKELISLAPPRPPYDKKDTVQLKRANPTSINPNNTTPIEGRSNMPPPEDLETILVSGTHEADGNNERVPRTEKDLATIVERDGKRYSFDQAPTDALTNERRKQAEDQAKQELMTLIEENGTLRRSNRQFTQDLTKKESSVKEQDDPFRETMSAINSAQHQPHTPSSPASYDTADLAGPAVSPAEKDEINRRMSQIPTIAQAPVENNINPPPVNFSDTQELNQGRTGNTIDLNVSRQFNKPGRTIFTVDGKSLLPADTDPNFDGSAPGSIAGKQKKLEAMMGERREAFFEETLELPNNIMPPVAVEMHVWQDPTSYRSEYIKQYVGPRVEGPRQRVAVIGKETFVAVRVPDNYFKTDAIKTIEDVQLVLSGLDAFEKKWCNKKDFPEGGTRYLQYKFTQREAGGETKQTTVQLPDKHPVLVVNKMYRVLEEVPNVQHAGVPQPEDAQSLGSQQVRTALAITDIQNEIANAYHIAEHGVGIAEGIFDSSDIDHHIRVTAGAKEVVLKEQFKKMGRDITDPAVQAEIKKKAFEGLISQLPNEIEDAVSAHAGGLTSQMTGMIRTGGLREKVNELFIEKISSDNAQFIRDAAKEFHGGKIVDIFFHPDSGAIFGLWESEKGKPIIITPHINLFKPEEPAKSDAKQKKAEEFAIPYLDQLKPEKLAQRYQETMSRLISSGKLMTAIVTVKDGALTVDSQVSAKADMCRGVLEETVKEYNKEKDH
ncbi:MAG: hypothetical protein RIQ54_440 [Candidatus Parcubacteria bacterium]|jgi:hypothetical protein